MKWAEGKMKQLKESVDGAAFPVSKPISYKVTGVATYKIYHIHMFISLNFENFWLIVAYW